jgi:hypothetical protein
MKSIAALNRVFAAGLVFACSSALSAGFFCALKHPKPEARALYPNVLVQRVDFVDTAAEAECLKLELDQVIDGRERCDIPNKSQIIRCLPAVPDPVVDPLPNRGGVGVEGAVGPKRAYRCLIQFNASTRKQVHTLLEASSWADVDLVRVATGARNEVARGACLPAARYDELFRLLGAEPPPSPFTSTSAGARAGAAAGGCQETAQACTSGCTARERAGIDIALTAAVCRASCENQRQACAARGGTATAGSVAPGAPPTPQRSPPSIGDLTESLRRAVIRP